MTPPLKLSHFYPRAATVLLAALLFCAFAASSAGAVTYVVDNSADTATPNACTGAASDCTLRGAIGLVNAGSTADVVNFDNAITGLVIGTPLPAITKQLTINGGGVTITGSPGYVTSCLPTDFALNTAAGQVKRVNLPIYNVCGRAVESGIATPTIQVGPRRADNTVAINGTGPAGSVEIYRADSPASSGEALTTFQNVAAPSGSYAYVPPTQPTPLEKFTAAATDGNDRTSGFAAPASAPADLTSPTLINAVANANNSVRLDFNEAIGPGVTPAGFALAMGAANRQVTGLSIYGNSVYLASVSTPWSTGEAGSVAITGSSRVTDLTGNELLGAPTQKVYAGPGELNVPVSSRFKASPLKFCQKKISKCRRGQTYLYLTLNKASRVIFNVYRANGRKFVVRFVHKLPVGTSKMRLFGTINGRTLPATSLVVQAVAEDAARNFSVPVEAPFKVVTRKAQL